jgi:site-specific DNA-methyltransferase (adenine-specific)
MMNGLDCFNRKDWFDMLEANKLYLGDCLELMKQISDKSIDCVICDPPFGSTPLLWDEILSFGDLWEEYSRIIKDDGVICLFGQEPFSSKLRLSNEEFYKYDWYWVKERLTNVFQVKRRPGKVIETISVFANNKHKYFPQKSIFTGKKVTNKIGDKARFSDVMAGMETKTKPLEYIDNGTRHPTQVLTFNRDDARKSLHPTQKPLALIEYLVKTYTNEGDLVLDNTMGSGTTCLAARNLNRKFIGMEKDETYFKIAQERLEKNG